MADQYVLYDLKHNSKKEFLSEFDWYKSRYINEPFNFAFNNKVVCNEMLKQHIRTPENYFIKNKGVIYDMQSFIYNSNDIYYFLLEHRKLFMKPFAMGKGKGVHLLSYENNNVYIDGVEQTKELFEKFIENNNNYLICEYMKQHSYASNIYDKTVNTIRVITFRDIETKKFKIFFAAQRIGTSKTIPVDNASKGGLVAKIDLNTGKLSAAKGLDTLREYEAHPDSTERIVGTQIPNWYDIKQKILKVSNMFPYMQMIAWDLLVIPDGVCVIEANTSSGINIIQLWGGKRKSEFGDFLRYHNVIKK